MQGIDRVSERRQASHQLRVNVKSLAYEGRIIRHEMKRVQHAEIKAILALHRQLRVRPEARIAHLALAFVRGRPYLSAESNAQTKPKAKDLIRKLERFMRVSPTVADEVEKWLLA